MTTLSLLELVERVNTRAFFYLLGQLDFCAHESKKGPESF